MKVVILAGGFGSRISEESHLRPKPMIEIGGKPILWHIMKLYSTYGLNEFIICAGYKSYFIKEYFADYFLHNSDITFNFLDYEQTMEVHTNKTEPWKVTIVDTGLNTMTGGRIKRIKDYVNNETFMLTYGDGVSNVNISELFSYHQKHGKIGTMTTVNVGQQYGVLDIDSNGLITDFREKSDGDGAVINAGFMVMNPAIFEYIDGDETVFEQAPLKTLTAHKQLQAFKHDGFWKSMDTQRDKNKLEDLWSSGNAPWKVW